MMRVNRTYGVSAPGLAEAAGIAVVATACAAVDRGIVGAGTTWAAIRRAGR